MQGVHAVQKFGPNELLPWTLLHADKLGLAVVLEGNAYRVVSGFWVVVKITKNGWFAVRAKQSA